MAARYADRKIARRHAADHAADQRNYVERRSYAECYDIVDGYEYFWDSIWEHEYYHGFDDLLEYASGYRNNVDGTCGVKIKSPGRIHRLK